ncbi:MAG: DUF3352 domain-containing protein, partial [Candidatus Limnocylindrales bacterium]
EGAMAIVEDDVMLLGTVASVTEAIDSGGEGGLASADWFQAADAALGEGDHVAAFYLNSVAYFDWLETVAATVPGVGVGGALAPATLERIPEWFAGELRIEGDALVFDAVTPHVEAAPPHENRLSEVVDNLPASTVAVIDTHDVGVMITDTIDQLRTTPEMADVLAQLDQAVALLGGYEGLIGWLGDASVVVTADGDAVGGGLVVSPTEPEAGTRFLTQLRGMVALGGGSLGISIRDVDHGGTTISYLELDAMVAGEDVPEIAFAATDEVVVLGVGEGFVESVLDVGDGTSLADSERYRAAIDRVGAQNFASFYVDISALRGLVETFGAEMPDEIGEYETELKPYLEPFDLMVGSSTHGSDVDRSTMLITVK